jgi:hypothetical protein
MAGDARAYQPCEGEMDTSIKEKPTADLCDYLAEERTFLAWISTGMALMGFGFVVAHFGFFVNEPHMTNHASGVDQARWHGHGSGYLSFDHRGARRTAVGHRE